MALRLTGLLPLLALLVACSGATKPPQDATTAPAAPSGPRALVVNDAAAANPALAATPVKVPDGWKLQAHTLKLPPGITASVLVAGLDRPRFMAFDEAGNLLVADMGQGAVYRFSAKDGAIAPQATPSAPLLSGLDGPSSLAVHDGYLYVGESRRVARFKYSPTGAAGPAEAIVPNLPTGGHSTKTVAFGPDGKLYLAMGSSCNICDESDERRAAVMRYNPDGTGYQLFAKGLRNAVGLAFQPGTGHLWATCNERDWQGDEIPPDLVTEVPLGANFGWPNCLPPDGAPQKSGVSCANVTAPTIGIQAHSAPLGLGFASGSKLPAPYDAGLYVAQHGSWNRQPPAEPKLLHVTFDAKGTATGVRIFASGWQDANGNRWGRPVGVLSAPDGSLVVSDDQAGWIYRFAANPG